MPNPSVRASGHKFGGHCYSVVVPEKQKLTSQTWKFLQFDIFDLYHLLNEARLNKYINDSMNTLIDTSLIVSNKLFFMSLRHVTI